MASRGDGPKRRVVTPSFLQMEATECGAASLKIILAYYGRHVPLEELRAECRVSRDGSNALYIKKAAQRYGLTARGFKTSVEALRKLEPPYMVFWELNHFLVVEGFGVDRVFLNDPAAGRRRVDLAAFRESYTGIVFRFEPGPEFRKDGRKPNAWRALASRMRGSRAAVAFVVLAGLAMVAVELVSATFPIVFIDQVLIGGRHASLRPLLLAMALAAAFRVAVGALQQGSLLRLKMSRALVDSARFLWHTLRLPIAFFQQRYAGDVAGRVEGNTWVADLISGPLATTAVGLLMLAFYAAMTFTIDPTLTAVGVAIGGLNLLGIAAVDRALTEEQLKIKQDRGKLHGAMIRSVQIIESIKASASEPEALLRLTGHQARATNASQVVGRLGGLLIVLPPFVSLATTAAVMGIGGGRVIDGAISVGVLVALQTLMAHLNRPFGDLVALGSGVQTLRAELARLDDVLDYPVDRPATTGKAEVVGEHPRRLSGRLELRNVTFGYNRSVDEPLIRDFSMAIRPGSRVALVGGSGSGKSTIGRLAVGLIRPWSGEVLHDGSKIDDIPREVFTDQVAMVDDQTFLFRGTIRDNLTLWDETISQVDMVRAAIDASIHRDLIARPGAYHSELVEGARNLSGGQRQRLEIARALVRNPALIVLDEATSALDPVTEAIVDDNLRRRGCTCLIIAHRLSTIRDCDEIIVLRQGRVVQRGTHDELMADQGGDYFALQSLQDAAESPPGPAPDDPIRAQVRDRSVCLPSPPGRGAGVRDRSVCLPSPPGRGAGGEGLRIAENGSKRPIPAANDPATTLTPALSQREREEAANGPATTLAPALSQREREEAANGPATTLAPAFSLREKQEDGRPWRTLSDVGESVETAGNRPLTLDDPEAAWRVEAGQVDVYYVESASSLRDGHRRHLCRVEEGGAIFSMEGVRGAEHGGLLAVGVGPARLLKVPVGELIRRSFDDSARDEVTAMLDDWVVRLGRASCPVDPPSAAFRLVAGEARDLEAGSRLTARSEVVWVRSTDESLRFLGDLGLPVCPYESRFPLSTSTWLESGAGGRIDAKDTPGLIENGDPWAGLRRFHRAVLDLTARAARLESEAAEARRRESRSRDGSRFAGSLAWLSGLARGRDRDRAALLAGDGPLLAACREVGAASGIAVVSTELDGSGDPLTLIARRSGFRTRRVRLGLEWWSRDAGPMLGSFRDDGRPVALIPSKRWGYRLVDPSRGVRRPLTPALAARLAPNATLFHRTLPGRPLSLGDLFRFSVPTLCPELKTLLLTGLLGGLLGLVVPWAVGQAIDDAIPQADRPRLGLLCGFVLCVGLAITTFQWVQSMALVRIRGKLEADLLPASWDRLLGLPPRFFARYESGDLASRALGLSTVIEILSGTWVSSLVVSSFGLINAVALFVLDWRLAIAAVALISVAPLLTMLAFGPLRRMKREIARFQGEISGLLLLVLGGIARIRVAGAEERAFARWSERYGDQLAELGRFQRLLNRLTIALDVWPLVVFAGVFVAMSRIGPTAMTTGGFLAFVTSMTATIAAVVGLCRGIIPLLGAIQGYDRSRPIFEASAESADVRGEPVTLAGAIRLADVSFRYNEDGPPILDKVSLQVRPGEFVAVVGPSGSGKSTLIRLLLGFEKPDEGSVAFDGRELPTLDVRDVRRQIGVVLQDAQLQPGDVFSNITGLASGMTRDDAWAAAELAGLADDLEQMPMGLHTVILEGGGTLSSGQRQRLLIARALAGRPKILIFDEATSALDNRTQAHVGRSVHEHLKGTTRLAIAHRLSTVVDADRIYVLVGGKIVQSGRFSQLINEPGPFQDLARRQSLT
jgi:NHLM bacteriocin system ABC transporter peptidase/ATP-binding protein/NHLM bacteriocin system ABC transporter ATP-binding protein